MGLLDSILGKKDSGAAGAEGAAGAIAEGGKVAKFAVTTSFRPMRLAARSDNSVELLLEVQNTSDSPQLCSAVIEVPKGLGFDGVGIHKTKELRLGQVAGGEKKNISVGLHASSQTAPGNYRIAITVYTHYRDYTHVLNSISKQTELRVV
jgi:uncharacterized membrane protein